MDEELLRKKVERAKKQNLIIVVTFCVFLVFTLVFFGVWKYQHTFSTDKWADSRENRIKIVNDMLEKHNLIGMNEQQVTVLLGEEDSNEVTSFKQMHQTFPPDTTLVYYLGVDAMDSAWLVLSMEEGIVTEIFIGLT